MVRQSRLLCVTDKSTGVTMTRQHHDMTNAITGLWYSNCLRPIEDNIGHREVDSQVTGPATANTAGLAAMGTTSSIGESTDTVNGALSRKIAQGFTAQRTDHKQCSWSINGRSGMKTPVSVFHQPYGHAVHSRLLCLNNTTTHFSMATRCNDNNHNLVCGIKTTKDQQKTLFNMEC